jgi:uncharacterized protein YdhG (YjbR/CyaY superfamily)
MEKKVISSVDEYILSQPLEIQTDLQALREVIQSAAPEATECISYGMPGYKQNGVLVWFAANKSHCGFYVRPMMLDRFRDRLKGFVMTKSAVHFPYGQPVLYELVAEITAAMVKLNSEVFMLKKKKKKGS